MSTYDDASLVFYPSGYKAGRADSLKPTDGTGDLTFTRASIATRVNEDGLIESVATGVPRIDFTGGGCGKLLLEPQRTNLALYSEQFDDAYWTKSASSITSNSTTAPDGTSSADTLLANGASSAHSVASPTISFALATSYSVSVFVKKGTNNFIQLFTGAAIGGMFANFNINAGTVGTVGTITGSNPTSSITNFGNGWYRCTMNFTTFLAGSTLVKFVIVSSASAAREETNTLATSVILWGAQLELGAYPTTYIPTTTASATRIADSFSRNNIYTNGLITSSGGTWFVELLNNVAYTRDSTGNFWLGDNSTSGSGGTVNSFTFRNNSVGSSRLAINKVINGTLTALYTTTTDTSKIAIKWNGSMADVFVNGTKVVSATSFSTTNMEFLSGQANDVPKFIQSIMLFSTPKSDEYLIALTTL
jgi:hypothetical protein